MSPIYKSSGHLGLDLVQRLPTGSSTAFRQLMLICFQQGMIVGGIIFLPSSSRDFLAYQENSVVAGA